MNLDIFNNLINTTKENGLINKFLKELEENLSKSNFKNQTLNGDNEVSLLQKIDNAGKVTVDYRDKMLIERGNILRNYAKETEEKGVMYFVYNKDTEENLYHISICEEGKSHVVIETDKNELPKGAGVDSVLRKVDGKYILDVESTKAIHELMVEMVDELLNEQTRKLENWRKEGHLYTVTENTGDKVWLLDSTYDSQNGICVDDVEFPKELMDIAKEGIIFQFINGEYKLVN